VAAGLAAGTINTVVGSGTLITFPTLLALGLPPVTANVTNTLGLVPGSISGAVGYRRELAGQRRRVLILSIASVIGGVVGAVLLLALPPDAFKAIVPVLIAIACILVPIQPWLVRRVEARRAKRRGGSGVGRRAGLLAGAAGTGVYGGYFGAAQGVLLIALLGVMLDEDLQRVNAVKNVLAGVVNGAAAMLFVFLADVRWSYAALIAIGAVVGGQLGAHVGRRLPAWLLRALVVVIGVFAIVELLTE
jgi:uncharacterized membrane protein YfcA